jgi:hypothetical protein
MVYELRRGKLLKRAGLVIIMGACAMLMSASQSSAATIDHFTEGPLNYTLDGTSGPMGRTDTQTGLSSVLGNTRVVAVLLTVTNDGNTCHVNLNTTGTGSFSVNNDDGVDDCVTITYPGGVGVLDGAGLFLHFRSADLAGATIMFTATANSKTGSSTQTGVVGPLTYFFDFGGFNGGLVPTDFTSGGGVTNLVLRIESVNAEDYTLDDISTGEIPEPLTMLGMFLGLGSVGAYIRKRRMA